MINYVSFSVLLMNYHIFRTKYNTIEMWKAIDVINMEF